MDHNTFSIDPDDLRQRNEMLGKECVRIQQEIMDLQAERQKISKPGELVKKVLATALLIREQHILGQKINHEIQATKREQDEYRRANAILEDNINFLRQYNSINAVPQRLLQRMIVQSARDALNTKAYQKFIERDTDASQQEIDLLNEEIRQLERKIALFDNAKMK